MNEIFSNRKVIICIGSGGVGKTTVAAALAVLAVRQGLRVLVLTIDPSKRLADTLGVDGSGDALRVPGSESLGSLSASVVNHRKTFDDFVRRAAQHSPQAEKILGNRLYQTLSGSLSGSQDFTALEKLQTSVESGEYDLVILDTPPAQHAMDFLQAPRKIGALFSEGIAKWFRQSDGPGSFWQGFLKAGTRQVFKVLESLTGSEFLHELADFFRHIEGWQDRLEKRTFEVHRLLSSPQTSFVLVTAFDQAKLMEAEHIARDVRQAGYHLETVILNRAFPEWLRKEKSAAPPIADPRLESLYRDFVRYYEGRRRDFEKFRAGLRGDVRILELPEMDEPVSDLKELAIVADRLNQPDQRAD